MPRREAPSNADISVFRKLRFARRVAFRAAASASHRNRGRWFKRIDPCFVRRRPRPPRRGQEPKRLTINRWPRWGGSAGPLYLTRIRRNPLPDHSQAWHAICNGPIELPSNREGGKKSRLSDHAPVTDPAFRHKGTYSNLRCFEGIGRQTLRSGHRDLRGGFRVSEARRTDVDDPGGPMLGNG